MRNLVFLLLTLVVFTACKNDKASKRESIETEEVSFTKDGTLTIYNSEDEELMHLDIEVAETDYEQETGLMYRKEMKENRGMLFVYKEEKPRPNFYMKNTLIALDLIYINAAKEIVDVNEHAQPEDQTLISSDVEAQYVLEVNSGMFEKWGLAIGDKVSFSID